MHFVAGSVGGDAGQSATAQVVWLSNISAFLILDARLGPVQQLQRLPVQLRITSCDDLTRER